MSHWSKGLRLLSNLGRLAARRPGRLNHVLGTALSASEEVVSADCDLLLLPQTSIEELYPETDRLRISLEVFPRATAAISPLEFVCLVVLMKKTNARRVFEFGTFQGVSITQLALNLPMNAQIYTLDLPDNPGQTRYAISDPQDLEIACQAGKGSLVPAELKERIHFLKQDSAEFDEGPFVGQMDFVFIDGAHNLDYVRNDSEKGWRMLRPGGIIVWHDCRPSDPDVVRYLVNCPYRPIRISATTLAFATKG
jgi:predicted O-methyltransferase YrrM